MFDNPKMPCLIEIGGHSGVTTALALERSNCNVIVLEPNPVLRAELSERFKHSPRVSIVEAALWNESDRRTFFCSREGHSGANSLHKDKFDLQGADEIQVNCIKASDMIMVVRAMTGPIMMNLNCEGAELEILNDLMDTGLHTEVKIFVKCHQTKMPNPERYVRMFERMDALGVDYLVGMYSEAWHAADKLGMEIFDYLAEKKGKPDWIEWFQGGGV